MIRRTLTPASDTATIIAGNTSITVTHGLGKVPNAVLITPLNIEAIDYYVTTKTTSQFTINMPVDQIVDCLFDWVAYKDL